MLDCGLWSECLSYLKEKGCVMLQTVPRAYCIERDMKYRSGWEVHLASATNRFEHSSQRFSR